MLSLELFDSTPLTDIELSIIKYVNENVKCIIRVLLDYLEDNNGFTPDDFLPYNNLRIDNDKWTEMVYDLYDIIRSSIIREYIKPKYEFLLYIILQWWDDCSDDPDELLINKLDSDLTEKIKSRFTSEDGENYVLKAITDFEEYYSILFTDHDFLPENIERMVTIYLRNPGFFMVMFPDVDLNEYMDLMPKDLKERFEELNCGLGEPLKKNVTEMNLLRDLFFCSERLQANHKYKDSPENDMNDFIRDLLTSSGYDLRDQTRQGTSSGGKQAGEVDILIRNDQLPYSIIEAVKLSSFSDAYLSEHIYKIYRYDTIGNSCNFIISYVKIMDFDKFWDSYILFAKSFKYPFDLINFAVPLHNQYPELKWVVTELKRNEIITKLYHIVIHIPN